MYFAKSIANIISLLILGSVFSNCVVFYGDSNLASGGLGQLERCCIVNVLIHLSTIISLLSGCFIAL